jgi:hypothetical protein
VRNASYVSEAPQSKPPFEDDPGQRIASARRHPVLHWLSCSSSIVILKGKKSPDSPMTPDGIEKNGLGVPVEVQFHGKQICIRFCLDWKENHGIRSLLRHVGILTSFSPE